MNGGQVSTGSPELGTDRYIVKGFQNVSAGI